MRDCPHGATGPLDCHLCNPFAERAHRAEAEVERLRAILRNADAERDRWYQGFIQGEHELGNVKNERDALREAKGHFQDLWIQRGAEVERLKAAIEVHSQCTFECPKCGHSEPCATDDVCLALLDGGES